MLKKVVTIDARSLVRDRPSGVSQYMTSILIALDNELSELDAPKDTVYRLAVPYRHAYKLGAYGFRNFKLVKIPLPFRGINFLIRKQLMPPIDLFLGRGMYVFPEFIRPPLLYSKSTTFIYDTVFRAMPESMDKRMLESLEKNVMKSMSKSDAIVTISNSTKRELSAISPASRNKMYVVYPSVNRAHFYPRSQQEIKKVLAKYEIFGKYILFVGNFEPRKNLALLFEAFSLLPRGILDDYQLLIVGASNWNSDDIYAKKEYFNQTGARIISRLSVVSDQDLPAIYSGASLFVYPSLYEGFGMPVQEAMACGTPVICSRNSSIPEAAGDAALYMNEKNPRDISDKIIEALTKDSSNLIVKGFEHVDTVATWKEASRYFQKIIDTAQKTSKGKK